ncbi:MAG: hypothetical protein JST87_03620 [Bacteroidetes bacterium]|nr:hypothetical protein [Bacteroidota bacterium]MBS1935148.1 hypothetical protein [Bacteroidota bacterium]
MQLQIDKKSSLGSIQKEFNTFYPFLKIEFFKRIPVDQPLYKTELFSVNESRKYLDGFYDGTTSIDIGRKRTVMDVEKDFEQMLGLSARIYRKSGNVWVETTLTNDWPLGEQNEEGREISSHFKPGKSS